MHAALAFLCCVAMSRAMPTEAAPVPTNIEAGTTLRYPVAFLAGQTDAPDGSVLQVENRSSRLPSRTVATQVLGGRWKALAELVPGQNSLVLRDASGESRLALSYMPMTTTHVVRVIYVVGAENNTDYLSQNPDDPQNYQSRLALAARLIQTFSGEAMHAAGWGRRTFRLEEDERGEVLVRTVRAPEPSSFYQKMSENEVGEAMRNIVNPRFPTGRARNLVIMGVSGYDAANRRKLGHTANANHGTGVFSALSLFSWPSSLAEVQSAFSNPTPVDESIVADDSNGRKRLWALASTTLGVTLHEMGHTFGLPHSPDRFSIMSRGHDFFNRFWTLAEPSDTPGQGRTFGEDEIAYWEPASAARLALSPFFEADARPEPQAPAPLLWSDIATGGIVASAPSGLGALALERDGLSRATLTDRAGAPPLARFRRADLEAQAGGPNFSLVAIDTWGRAAFASLDSLLDARLFVRSWRFSPAPLELADPRRLPSLAASRVREIGVELGAQPLAPWWSGLIDLNAHYKTSEARNRVAYAAREFSVARAQRALLLTGSDDSLRVWLNGELVIARPVLRAARPDEDRARVSLHAGRNTLLVEVGTGGGGWAFALRLASESGQPLAITSDGALGTVEEIYNPSLYLSKWRFSSSPLAWRSREKFNALEPGQREALEVGMASLPEQNWPSPYIDLLAHFRSAPLHTTPPENVVAYAMTTIHSEQARRAVLHTGSDDALRVWLNGELIVEKLALRSAEPDSDRTPITLRAGQNRILVEVSTTGGGWGFYARLT